MNPRPPVHEPAEAEIQHAAYLLWEQEGRPAGRELEFWLSARERLRHTVHPPGAEWHWAMPATIAARNAQPPGRKRR